MIRNLISIRNPIMFTYRNPLMFTHLRAFSNNTYENILVERREGGVGLITLTRPKALNALCFSLFRDLITALEEYDKDPTIHAIVLTGSKKAFAAGADIKEMEKNNYPDTYMKDMLTWWDKIT